ncbi:MAG: hypothetical protein IAI50_07050 [Candidatus Eremiobacteraeota bacterium]|nr:hypothetical protein [Candidatus Eremiobacteraeota bacterium]
MKRTVLVPAIGVALAIALYAGIAAFHVSHANLTSVDAQSIVAQADLGPPAGTIVPRRRGFLGAFFRAQGPPPFGVFDAQNKAIAPAPYPSPGNTLFGAHGYCDAIAPNGVSISSGNRIDAAKLADIVDLGVGWTRTTVSSFFDDRSHIDGTGSYAFGDFDSAQCALLRHAITPLVELSAGPVMYDATPGTFAPISWPHYRTTADFAEWCAAVASHERRAFPAVYRYSLPGNEVNSNPELFSEGFSQIADYTKACYRAVKKADPKAFVYGLELNMDPSAEPAAFVQRMYDLGCKRGTCYDGLSIHLSLHYPIPPAGTPCAPDPGGTASMACVDAIRTAAHDRIHVIIGETVYTVPGSVPDEEPKAKAIAAEFVRFAENPNIDGVNYANIDECAMYSSGYFAHGCLVDTQGRRLPAYAMLRRLAARDF